MALIRTCILLCATALAVTAAPAAASGAVEFDHEPSGENCNPCVFTTQGEAHLNIFGIRVSGCAVVHEWEIYHDGTGHIGYSNGQHDSGGTCTRIACNGVGEAHSEAEFDILQSEESAPNTTTATYRFCLDAAANPDGTGTHCTGPIDIVEGGDHLYGFSLHTPCAGGIIEIEGDWDMADGDAIEITHL